MSEEKDAKWLISFLAVEKIPSGKVLKTGG
jgi:hypothetical protein